MLNDVNRKTAKCPLGHAVVHKRRQGAHTGMFFCYACGDWYPEERVCVVLDSPRMFKDGRF